MPESKGAKAYFLQHYEVHAGQDVAPRRKDVAGADAQDHHLAVAGRPRAGPLW